MLSEDSVFFSDSAEFEDLLVGVANDRVSATVEQYAKLLGFFVKGHAIFGRL